MGEIEVIPELKQIVGALLFGAKQPLTLAEMRRVLGQTAEVWGGVTKDFAKASEADLKAAVEQLKADLAGQKLGIHVSEVANGYRLENDVSCGPWLRMLLERGKPQRLSRPALETLAIIAYRQPCTRPEIEAVRGVAVDEIVRNLMEMGLIRIMGRSELPGRPWQLGTTQKFLEHFGLKGLDDLPGIDELRRMENERIRREEEQQALAEVPQGQDAAAAGGTPEAGLQNGAEGEESGEDADDEEEEDEGENPSS